MTDEKASGEKKREIPLTHLILATFTMLTITLAPLIAILQLIIMQELAAYATASVFIIGYIGIILMLLGKWDPSVLEKAFEK